MTLTNSGTRRPTILVVEDNPADVTLIEEALAEAKLDCILTVLGDGAAAIDMMQAVDASASGTCPDLVVLDLNLPKVNGEEVLRRIRQSPRCSNARVLIASSSNAPSDRDRVMRLGANDYFRKPSTLQQYMEIGPKIRSMLLQ
jgi:CheY-like chemotaxis protein